MTKTSTVTSIVLSAALALGASNVQAGMGGSHKDCKALQETAETIMEARQEGHRMSALMEWAQHNDATVEAYQEALVKDAYNVPNYSSDRYQRKAIRDFGNEVYKVCIEDA